MEASERHTSRVVLLLFFNFQINDCMSCLSSHLCTFNKCKSYLFVYCNRNVFHVNIQVQWSRPCRICSIETCFQLIRGIQGRILFLVYKYIGFHGLCTVHNELLVQVIPCATLVTQSKHQSDHVFERKCLFYKFFDLVIILCLQLNSSDRNFKTMGKS